MNEEKSTPDDTQDSQEKALELYKTAFAQLTFQDDYLFKFSTVFLTVHGALAVLARSAFSETGTVNAEILGFASAVGLLLAIIWIFWTRHNDYWHSVWIGTLRTIEPKLGTSVRIFLAKHGEIARKGGRNGALVPRGHSLAMAIPMVLGTAWTVALYIALCRLC